MGMEVVPERIIRIVRAVHQLGAASNGGKVTWEAVIAKLREDAPVLVKTADEALVRQFKALIREEWLYGGEEDGRGWCRVGQKGLTDIGLKALKRNVKKGGSEMPPEEDESVAAKPAAKRISRLKRARLGWDNTPGKTPEEKMAYEMWRDRPPAEIFNRSPDSAVFFMDELRKAGVLVSTARFGAIKWAVNPHNIHKVSRFERGKIKSRPASPVLLPVGPAAVAAESSGPEAASVAAHTAATSLQDATAKVEPCFLAAKEAASHLAGLSLEERKAALMAMRAIGRILPGDDRVQQERVLRLVAAFYDIENQEE